MKGKDNLKFILALLIIFSLFWPHFSLQPIEACTEKIHPEVAAALGSDNFIPILIKLAVQKNSEELAAEAAAKIAEDLTPRQRALKTRETVVGGLQAVAASSQRSLLHYLESAVEVGKAKEIRSFFIVNMISVKVHPTLVESLAGRSDVGKILPNARVHLNRADMTSSLTSPEDARWNLEQINAIAAHERGFLGSGVVIGLIDTGVDWEHPDLKSRWRGDRLRPEGNWFDVVSGKAMPYDNDGHGTCVAGILVGANGTGVAPKAQWIAVKAFDSLGHSNADWLLAAGEYMLSPLDANGIPQPQLAPDIINNSWGLSTGLNEWYRPMVQAWVAAGIIPVFAAGNVPTPGSLNNPASYPESLAVASIGRNQERSYFSAQGPPPYPWLIKPEISAPGENIRTTKAGGDYIYINGTSAAAPHVSGAAAVLLSMDPTLSPPELKAMLIQAAAPLTDIRYMTSPNYGYGYGLVNVGKAVNLGFQGTGVITGSVFARNTNETAPIIEHSSIGHYFAGVPQTIAVNIRDKLGVVKAEVIILEGPYQASASYPLELESGDYNSGYWAFWLSDSLLSSQCFDYTIQVTNRAGITSSSGPNRAVQNPGLVPAYSTDFSDYPWGWIWGEQWKWGGAVDGDPIPRFGSFIGTNKNYRKGGVNYLYSPPLDLRNVCGGKVIVDQWFKFAPGDHGSIILIDDDELWQVVANVTGSSLEWEELVIDLSPWDSWPVPVKLIFELESNTGASSWFIDRFCLDGQNGITLQTPEVKLLTESDTASLIPLKATVTVLETGQTVHTGYGNGLFTGQFLMVHPPTRGEPLTLRVEARGYYPRDIEFTLTQGKALKLDVVLEPRQFDLSRLSGTDRYATAAAISRKGWDTSDVVFLARGDDFADAMTGVPLAYAYAAPMLLTQPDSLPDVIRGELMRINAKKVYILGGEDAISPNVPELLFDLGMKVERLAGKNRYDTAAEIARRLSQITEIKCAVIANGNFPDALAAAALAANQGMPILLTQAGSIPVETNTVLDKYKIARTLVSGGESVINEDVFENLPNPMRLGGENRFETASLLAQHFNPPAINCIWPQALTTPMQSAELL